MDNASIHHVLESAVQMTEDAGALVHFLPILQIWTQLRSLSKLKYFLIGRMAHIFHMTGMHYSRRLYRLDAP